MARYVAVPAATKTRRRAQHTTIRPTTAPLSRQFQTAACVPPDRDDQQPKPLVSSVTRTARYDPRVLLVQPAIGGLRPARCRHHAGASEPTLPAMACPVGVVTDRDGAGRNARFSIVKTRPRSPRRPKMSLISPVSAFTVLVICS